jgi:aminobenzoyl-glutamate utilization protein B
MKEAKEIALNWIEDNRDLISELNYKIWEFAELGLQEYKSSKLITSTLKDHGFKVYLGVADMPTALVGTWGEGKPVIGIQGEYDALPNLSQKPVPYKDPIEEGAPGHGCGHNIYGSSGVGGAIAAKIAMESEGIPGTVKFFGSPAEETLVGKVFMVREGLYEGTDAVLGHHIGTVNSASLSSSNAMNSVKFEYHGESSHAGSTPWQGRSALDAVELLNVGVNYMREHIVPQARIHYIIQESGIQPNVVPDFARVWYYMRAPERKIVEDIYDWIGDIAESAAKATQTRLEIKFQSGVYNKLPNRTLAETVVKNMREIGTPTYTEEELEFARKIGEQISPEDKRNSGYACPGWEDLMDVDLNTNIIDPYGEGEVSGGSTDMADVSWQTPTLGFNSGSRILGAPGHHWMMVATSGMSIGHKNAVFGAKVHACTTIDLLTKPEILQEAWEELEERKKGREYKSPLPPDLKPPLDQFEPAKK